MLSARCNRADRDCTCGWVDVLVEDARGRKRVLFFFREPDWERSGWISAFVRRDCTKWTCDREGRNEVVWLVFLSFYDSWWFLYAGFVRRCRLYWKDEIEQDVRGDGQWGKFFIAGVNCEFIFRGTCFLVLRERPESWKGSTISGFCTFRRWSYL